MLLMLEGTEQNLARMCSRGLINNFRQKLSLDIGLSIKKHHKIIIKFSVKKTQTLQ